MAVKVKAIPDGYHTVTPYFTVRDAARAVEFYKRAFGAVELMRMADSSGKIRHAEIRIGDSPIMLGDEFPEFPEMRSFQALRSASIYTSRTWTRCSTGRSQRVRTPVKDEFYATESAR